MALRKRGKRKKRKNLPKGFIPALFIAGCLIASGILIYYLYHPASRVLRNTYEEASGTSSEMNEKISRIDHSIYEALYRGGVEERDIYFSEVTAGNGKDSDWEFTELSVKITDQKAGLRLGAIIEKDLSKLKQDVVINRDSITQREVVYNVFSSNHHTHRIRLISKDGWQAPNRGLPKVAIVIDDVGNDYDIAEAVMKIDLPLTLSILPSSRYGKDVAEKARQKGFEVIMHLPMEPKNYPKVNPGPDALLTKMNESEIRTVIDQDLKRIPGVRGVNNHMGSYFTERQDKMTYVLRELKKRDLFYLDSRTTRDSVGFNVAEAMGVPSAKKNVFLDNDLSSKAIKYQMERLIGTSRYAGEAIGIGHPHEATLEVLKDYEGLLKRNFKVVPVSELMK